MSYVICSIKISIKNKINPTSYSKPLVKHHCALVNCKYFSVSHDTVMTNDTFSDNYWLTDLCDKFTQYLFARPIIDSQ